MEDLKRIIEYYISNNDIDWKYYKNGDHFLYNSINNEKDFYILPFFDNMILLDSNKKVLNIFKNEEFNHFKSLTFYINDFIVCGFGNDEYIWYYKIYDNNYNLLYGNFSELYFLDKPKGIVCFIDKKNDGLNSFIYYINNSEIKKLNFIDIEEKYIQKCENKYCFIDSEFNIISKDYDYIEEKRFDKINFIIYYTILNGNTVIFDNYGNEIFEYFGVVNIEYDGILKIYINAKKYNYKNSNESVDIKIEDLICESNKLENMKKLYK